jgi:hypothetical protein
MALEGEVKTPFGKISKKTAVIGGVAVAGIGGVLYWRYRKNQAASAASSTSGSTTGMVTDPAGNQCASVDPDTGYCPGTPEDEQTAQQSLYGDDIGEGYGESVGYGAYPGGTGDLYTDPNGVVCTTPGPDGYCPQTTTATPTTAVTTNSQWLTEVEATFPSYTQAIAMVLGGVSVTTAQRNQFLEAVGVYGPPPQGYPPIQTTDTAAQPTGTTGTSAPGTVSVPNVRNDLVNTATAKLTSAGFKYHLNGPTRVKTSEYTINSQTPGPGTKAAKGSTVDLSYAKKA